MDSYLPFFGAVALVLAIGFVWIYSVCWLTDRISDLVPQLWMGVVKRLNVQLLENIMPLVPLAFLLPLLLVLALPTLPLLIPPLFVYLAARFARLPAVRRIGWSLRFAYHAVALTLADFREDARVALRVLRSMPIMIGLLGVFQEIREIVVRVERGEWRPELGDPFDHVKYETKRGMFMARSLLGDRVVRLNLD